MYDKNRPYPRYNQLEEIKGKKDKKVVKRKYSELIEDVKADVFGIGRSNFIACSIFSLFITALFFHLSVLSMNITKSGGKEGIGTVFLITFIFFKIVLLVQMTVYILKKNKNKSILYETIRIISSQLVFYVIMGVMTLFLIPLFAFMLWMNISILNIIILLVLSALTILALRNAIEDNSASSISCRKKKIMRNLNIFLILLVFFIAVGLFISLFFIDNLNYIINYVSLDDSIKSLLNYMF